MNWPIALAWYAFGVWSHTYWIRNERDYTAGDVFTSLFCGLVGPLSFWIGWVVYGTPSKGQDYILFRKRYSGRQ